MEGTMNTISILYNLIIASVGCLVYMFSVTIYVKYNFNLTIDIRDDEVRVFMLIITSILYFTLEYLDGRKLSWYLKLI